VPDPDTESALFAVLTEFGERQRKSASHKCDSRPPNWRGVVAAVTDRPTSGPADHHIFAPEEQAAQPTARIPARIGVDQC